MQDITNKTNEDLRYIIRYTDLKAEAWAQLLLQSPSNGDLRYIIEYTDLKAEAGAQLLLQSPSNGDLRYIIRYTDLKAEARNLLCENLGIQPSQLPNEEELIEKIAEAVFSRPDALKMNNWHCGTSHCLAGWATVLCSLGLEVEEKSDTETAGCVLIPSLAHLFFNDDATVKAILQDKITL